MKESDKTMWLLKALIYIQIAFVALLVLVLAFAQAVGAQLSLSDALGVFGGAVIIELIVFGALGLFDHLRILSGGFLAAAEVRGAYKSGTPKHDRRAVDIAGEDRETLYESDCSEGYENDR